MPDALSEPVPACIGGAEALQHRLVDETTVRIVIE